MDILRSSMFKYLIGRLEHRTEKHISPPGTMLSNKAKKKFKTCFFIVMYPRI